MSSEAVDDIIADMRAQLVNDLVAEHIPPNKYAEQWNVEGLEKVIEEIFGKRAPISDWAKQEGVADTEIAEKLLEETSRLYAQRAAEIGPDIVRRIEKAFLLHVLDTNWREHLQQLDHLRSVVWMRGHAQRDPINEFKTEAFALFGSLLDGLRRDVTRMLMHVQVRAPEQAVPERRPVRMTESHIDPVTGENEMASSVVDGPMPRSGSAGVATMYARARAATVDPLDQETWGRVSRNAPCPCGSGQKYKACHGKI
jgi:preprotein translocase subunit SecA